MDVGDVGPVLLVMVALGGLLTGSFCNVVIHRLPLGTSVIDPPRSACPVCDSPIPASHNIPLVSWIVLRGRAKCCGADISPQYMVVEASVALLWVLLYLMVGPTVLLVAILPFAAGAVCVAVIDTGHHRIPHALSGSLAGLAAIGAMCVAVVPGASPSGDSVGRAILIPLGCGAAASWFLWLVRAIHPPAMGGGDVRLAFSVACVAAVSAGWQGSLVSMLAALLTGSLLGSVLFGLAHARGQADARRKVIPFGPHLALGGLVGALWGQPLWSAYLSVGA